MRKYLRAGMLTGAILLAPLATAVPASAIPLEPRRTGPAVRAGRQSGLPRRRSALGLPAELAVGERFRQVGISDDPGVGCRNPFRSPGRGFSFPGGPIRSELVAT